MATRRATALAGPGTDSPTSTRRTSTASPTRRWRRRCCTRGARSRWRTPGQGTNGSQFFLVYKDSELPPTYTVFGTVDETGLAVVDKIAAAGVKDGSDDGKPATAVTIESVRLN